jgi:transposase-like protein
VLDLPTRNSEELEKRGRATDKTLVLGLVEDKDDSAGNLHLRALPRANRDSVHPVVLDRVDLDACVQTDGWHAYDKLEDEGFEHEATIQDEPEDAGETLPWVHIVFSNLKRVIKGTHGTAEEATFQGYLDRLTFRFNWRSRLGEGLDRALDALATSCSVTRKQIRDEDLMSVPG